MCRPKSPTLPDAPEPRAMERLPDRANARTRAAQRVGYTPRYGQTAPGTVRRRAPTAILGATSNKDAPGVVLGA